MLFKLISNFLFLKGVNLPITFPAALLCILLLITRLMLQEKKQLFSKNYTLKFWTRKGGFFSTVKCKILKSYSQICNVDCRINSFRKTNRCSIPHYLPFPINCTNSDQIYKGKETKQNWSVFSKKMFIPSQT